LMSPYAAFSAGDIAGPLRRLPPALLFDFAAIGSVSLHTHARV